MSCYCDYDPCDIWDERRRKARVVHKCGECSEPIEPGDEYLDISYLSEGEWGHHKMCECCDHDRKTLVDAGHCWYVGSLAEAWDEMWRWAAPIEPVSDTVVMRGGEG